MKKVSLTVCFILFFASSALLIAQEVPYRLDDIIVTAERIATPLGEAPANISIITKEDIEDSGARTIIDIFEIEPGMTTSNLLGSPKRAQIDIRGYGETAPQNVLFLVDGRRINSIDLSGTDLTQIPIEMVERVEIYRGPVGVLFGDNAAGGVVNIILRKGDGKPKVTVGATAGSYELYQPHISVSGKQSKVSYFALATGLNTDGYRHNNNLRSNDVFGNFVFDPFQNISIGLKAGFHKDKYGLPGALYKGYLRKNLNDLKDSIYPFDNSNTEDSFIDAEAAVKIGTAGIFSVGASYRNRNNTGNFYFVGGFSENKQKLETISLTPKLVIDKDIFSFKNSFILGWDFYKYPTTVDVDGTSSFGPSRTITDIDRSDNAFYVNDRFYPVKSLLLEAGYRIQKVKYSVDHRDFINPVVSLSSDTHQEKEAYRFSANYLFGKQGDIFVTYARGFRFPVTDEFVVPGYCLFGFCQPTIFYSDLDAQTTNEIDVGFRYNPANYLGGTVTFFQAKNKNEIYYNPMLYTNMNYDRTKRTGVEASLFFRPFNSFLATINYSHIKAIFDGGMFDGNEVPFVPKNKLGIKLSYTVFDNFTFNLMALARSNCYVISDQKNQQPKLAGYTTYDTSVVWRKKAFTVLFAIKNLTGKKYNEYGVYSSFANDVGLYPSPGRQYFFTIQYTVGG